MTGSSLLAMARERGGWLVLAMLALQVGTLAMRGVMLGPEAHLLVAGILVLSLLAGAAVLWLPERAVQAVESGVRAVHARDVRASAALLLVSFALLFANVFLQQPHAWDERGILDAAPRIATFGFGGLIESYRVNPWLGPQHPPLPPLLYAVVWALGGASVFAMRMVGVVLGCGVVLLAFRIGARLFDRTIGFAGAALLLTTPLFVRTASAATNDIPLMFLFCLAILFGIRLLEAPSDRRAVALGVVIGIGLLTKYTMVFVYPVLLALLLPFGRPPRIWRLLAIVLAVSLGMLAVWLVLASTAGILERQTAKVGQLATVSTRSTRWALQGLFVRLPSALGIYAIPVILLGMWDCARSARSVRSANGFALAWLFGIGVPLVVTLPVNRFFLPAFPAVTIVMALALADRRANAVRVALLLAALCGITLLYYAWVDLSIPLSLYGGPSAPASAGTSAGSGP